MKEMMEITNTFTIDGTRVQWCLASQEADGLSWRLHRLRDDGTVDPAPWLSTWACLESEIVLDTHGWGYNIVTATYSYAHGWDVAEVACDGGMRSFTAASDAAIAKLREIEDIEHEAAAKLDSILEAQEADEIALGLL